MLVIICLGIIRVLQATDTATLEGLCRQSAYLGHRVFAEAKIRCDFEFDHCILYWSNKFVKGRDGNGQDQGTQHPVRHPPSRVRCSCRLACPASGDYGGPLPGAEA